MQKPGFQTWPVWDGEDVSAVRGAIESGNWWCGAPEDRTGEQVWSFQREFASFQESKHCIAVANGTVALEAVGQRLDAGEVFNAGVVVHTRKLTFSRSP